jgi:Lon protease-like protein
MHESTITIPDEAPVMFLPNAILFPHALLPLYIFEEKYRTMLRHCLEHGRMFCIALAKPDVSEVAGPGDYHHVGCIGLIRACVGNEDGTSNLILQGLQRVRFGACKQARPFRILKLAELKSEMPNQIESEALGAKVVELCRQLKQKGVELPAALEKHIELISHPGVLSDVIAHAFIEEPETRLRLLEERSVSERLRLLIGELSQMAN